MTDQKRQYRMKRRAELQEQTRLRITESTVELHGTIGPSRTSISAVAERAGVRRSTVYRHFPDEAALFAAGTPHWLAANPPPDLDRWSAIGDPDERLRAALGELYAHYRSTERMRDNLVRDEPVMPIIKHLMGRYHTYLTAAGETLVHGRGARGGAATRVRAAIGHALGFTTWRSLAREQRLTDAEAVELMFRLVVAAGARVRG
jgi:AcrR family transcriptional regulator